MVLLVDDPPNTVGAAAGAAAVTSFPFDVDDVATALPAARLLRHRRHRSHLHRRPRHSPQPAPRRPLSSAPSASSLSLAVAPRYPTSRVLAASSAQLPGVPDVPPNSQFPLPPQQPQQQLPAVAPFSRRQPQQPLESTAQQQQAWMPLLAAAAWCLAWLARWLTAWLRRLSAPAAVASPKLRRQSRPPRRRPQSQLFQLAVATEPRHLSRRHSRRTSLPPLSSDGADVNGVRRSARRDLSAVVSRLAPIDASRMMASSAPPSASLLRDLDDLLTNNGKENRLASMGLWGMLCSLWVATTRAIANAAAAIGLTSLWSSTKRLQQQLSRANKKVDMLATACRIFRDRLAHERLASEAERRVHLGVRKDAELSAMKVFELEGKIEDLEVEVSTLRSRLLEAISSRSDPVRDDRASESTITPWDFPGSKQPGVSASDESGSSRDFGGSEASLADSGYAESGFDATAGQSSYFSPMTCGLPGSDYGGSDSDSEGSSGSSRSSRMTARIAKGKEAEITQANGTSGEESDGSGSLRSNDSDTDSDADESDDEDDDVEITTHESFVVLASSRLITSLSEGATSYSLSLLLDDLHAKLDPPPERYPTIRAATRALLLFSLREARKSTSASAVVAAAALPGGPPRLASTAREVFRRHSALLAVQAQGTRERTAVLDELETFCHSPTETSIASSHPSSDSDGPAAPPPVAELWRAAFGLLVFGLYSADVLEDEDIVQWWRARRAEDMAETAATVAPLPLLQDTAVRAFMDQLVTKLEVACSESESDEDDDDDADDDDSDNNDDDDDDDNDDGASDVDGVDDEDEDGDSGSRSRRSAKADAELGRAKRVIAQLAGPPQSPPQVAVAMPTPPTSIAGARVSFAV
ncbi:hypothetical protein HK405_007241 [Cladochytrium tenue]|nr:hypothetical protein HK405_007241 [Cladochytrium tenue]